MSQAIQLQVTQVGLEQSIAAAMKRVGSSSQINLGTNSRQINALSQPLGRITGQADEFSKSMEAANARVLAFGASAGIIAGVSKAMAGLVSSTIKVEKSLVEIGSVLNKTGADLDKFGQDIFNVAKNTGQSFDEVAKGALELSRQGLNAEDTLARLNDALILSRLSGLDATQSVEGLTAAFNSFQKSGITTAEILNKVVAVSQKYAVSERDIIEGLKRSAAVADLAGVSFEELAALITAVQQKTARGGAVIGNAFKTIFSRLQDKAVLSDLQDMGIAVTDLQGNVLPALKILEGLAGQMDKISQIEQADIAKKLGGVYQLDKLLAALKDLSSETSVTKGALDAMGKAGDSAYKKNAVLNETLSALINKVAVSAEQLGAKLGDIGVTDSLKNILGFFNNLLEGIQNILGEESGLGNLVRGLVKGLGSFLAGPGLALFGGIILKLSKDLVQFGFASLKAFFGIGKAAKDVQNVEGAISQILAKNVGLQQQLFALEGNRAAQLRLITGALVEQEALLRRSASISSGLAAPLYNVGARATTSGLRINNSAGGYMPTVAKESNAIKQGVGGARSGDKPVVMPNFNFGGGKKGTMVAHTGEYVVPNFNGSGGSAVFNRRMVQSMGLPSGAKKIGSAGGFVPNFARGSKVGQAGVLNQLNLTGNESIDDVRSILSSSFPVTSSSNKALTVKYGDEDIYITNDNINNSLKKGSQLSQEYYYNSNKNPAALMLVPQNRSFDPNALNTRFANQKNQNGTNFDGFIGGIAGVNPAPDDKKFAALTNIDNEIGNALSISAANILNRIEPGIKVEPDSLLSPQNILKSVLAEGGAGAFGSFKGALFESIIKLVTKGKGQEGGRLDVDFNQGRDALEAIFGIKGKGYQYADFKNSTGQKDKFISQVMTNLPVSSFPEKKQRGMTNAAGGYIPNFSKYIYDSDRLNPDKGATLAAVLSSKAKKNLLIGPAGSGKSTFAGKSGQFLSGIDDVPKATEIDILSGAARAKGGLSKSLESIIAAVNSSGGKVSYLYTKNLEILSRRRSRTSPSEGDLRSIKQLKGTRYAPLNQFDFLSNVKSKSKNFNLIQGAAGGYIPNFADLSGQIGSAGVRGGFFKLKNSSGEDRKRIGVKKFDENIPIEGLKQPISQEWLSGKQLYNSTAGQMITGPKIISGLGESIKSKSIIKQIISDKLARDVVGGEKSREFGTGFLAKYIEQKTGLRIPDLHGGNYTANDAAKPYILGGNPKKGAKINIIDTGLAKANASALSEYQKLINQAGAKSKTQKKVSASAAGGYIPNFAGSQRFVGAKKIAMQITKVMGVGLIKQWIDSRLGDGFVDNIEAAGLHNINPKNIAPFLAELSKPTRGKHQRAFDSALLEDPLMQRQFAPRYRALLAEIAEKRRIDSAAGGFLPNFANPLQAAVGREMAAGVPASQIYIDKSPALKNAGNPMGLMVANRRDEPAGGFQGVNRARREGANPMTYGAAGGFVPNYAAGGTGPDLTNFVGKTKEQALAKELELYVDAMSALKAELDKATADHKKARGKNKQALADQIKALEENKKTLNENSQATRKAIQEQTRGVLGSGRTLTGRQATVPGPSAGGNRDMLGTVFAVQSGLSVLTGATEGATNSIAKYTNVVADSVGSATSTLFAFQGLATAIPKAAGFLGPLGIAASAVTAAYKIGTGVLNEYFGINKIVAQSLYTISKAADEASVNLSKLDPEAKSKIEKESKDILAAGLKTGRFETVTEGSRKESDRTTYQREIIARFEKDVTGKLAKNAQDSIAQARGAGVSSAKINEVIQKYSKDALITLDEARELPKTLANLITEVDTLAKSAIDLIRKSDDPNVMAAKAAIGKMTPAEISKQADPSKMTMAERAVFAGYQPNTAIEDMAEREKKLIEDYATGEGGTTFKFKKPEDPTTDPFGFLRKRLQLDAGPTSDKRLEDLGLSIQQESKTKSDEGFEKDKSFKANLGAIQAQIALENKLASFKEGAANLEIAKLKEIERIKNDNLLTEDERAKAIANVNFSYDQGVQALQTTEQKTKNIGQALIESVKSGIGVIPDQIQATIDNIQQGLSNASLPELNVNNLKEYADQVKEIVKGSGVYEDNQKAIVEALIEAERTNKGFTAEQDAQLKKAAEQLGIELKTLGITRDRAIEEAKINSMMDNAKAAASFKLEKRSLDIAFDTLAINQQIEKIKRETSLNELEKAQQIFKLEEQRVGLEEGKIQVDFDKSANDAARTFQDKILGIADSQFGIKSSAISDSLSGGPESVIKAARNLIKGDQKTSFDQLIANERKNLDRDLELATKQKDLDKSGIAPVIPDTVIDKVNRGFSGGMSDGVASLQNQINTFAFDLGEKIPQMFSDNMSSAINKMIEGGESFGNILQGAAYEFVKGINQANIKNLSDKFSNSLFNKNESGQTGIGSFFGSIGNLFASGGKVTGGSGSKDDVPAMLMGGEYVVNKKAVSKYGAQFMESINSGTLSGYAKGGKVQSGPQGNFYTPGTFGQGSIKGKRNLLDFATQSGTSGQFDQMTNSGGYQSISLEPESSRLSVSGMRNSPMFDATQSAKGQAFDLYLQQYNAEREAKKQEKEQKKALTTQLIMLAGSAALGPVIKAAGSGFGAAFKGADGQGFMSQLGAGFKGALYGGNIGGQQVGGLSNLFSSAGKALSGDFTGASNQFKLSQISNSSQLADLYKSDKGFASYIDGMGGFNASGAPKVTSIISEARRSGYGKGTSINGNTLTKNEKLPGAPPEDFLPSNGRLRRLNKYEIGWTGRLGFSKQNNSMDSSPGFLPDKPNGKAIGGMIPSTSGIDTVPAMLSGGEFVMNRSAVQGIGASNLQSMNSGGTSITSEETSKELNEKLLAKLDELINSSGSAGNITINVAPSGQTTQENSQDPSAGRQQLARQIKDAVLQIINDEKRIGGSLRR